MYRDITLHRWYSTLSTVYTVMHRWYSTVYTVLHRWYSTVYTVLPRWSSTVYNVERYRYVPLVFIEGNVVHVFLSYCFLSKFLGKNSS